MPRLPSTAVLDTLLKRNATQIATNNTTQVLHVICEFPLSGQYGPGSRYLYYLLIIACVLGDKSNLLRKVGLAAALIFPALAAVHAIVLAALHNDGFVDMDIFGAFQLCSIGILAAPVTVKRSRAYWAEPGKIMILPWTILILAGLLSLTVEFCRTKTHSCPYDNSGQPTSTNPHLFNYNNPPNCSITCSTTQGPFSGIRQDSANSIFLIPAPERITFGMGTLFSAGCCIPPVLYLVYMWIKILKHNWTKAFAEDKEDVERASRAPGNLVRDILDYQEFLLFGALVVCILVLGEWNFYSVQVKWQSEPWTAVGQWATFIGPAFAVAGAWFVRGRKEEKKTDGSDYSGDLSPTQPQRDRSPASSQGVAAGGFIDETHRVSNAAERTSTEAEITPSLHAAAVTGERSSGKPMPVRVQDRSLSFGNRLLKPSRDLFHDDKEWRREGDRYIRTPAEDLLNHELEDTEARYHSGGGADGSTTPIGERHSRSGSFTSVNSRPGNALRDASTSREPSSRRATLPDEGTSSEQTALRTTLTPPSERHLPLHGGSLLPLEPLDVCEQMPVNVSGR